MCLISGSHSGGEVWLKPQNKKEADRKGVEEASQKSTIWFRRFVWFWRDRRRRRGRKQADRFLKDLFDTDHFSSGTLKVSQCADLLGQFEALICPNRWRRVWKMGRTTVETFPAVSDIELGAHQDHGSLARVPNVGHPALGSVGEGSRGVERKGQDEEVDHRVLQLNKAWIFLTTSRIDYVDADYFCLSSFSFNFDYGFRWTVWCRYILCRKLSGQVGHH